MFKYISGECLDAVYDVTIAYPDTKYRYKYLTERDIFNGMFPEEIHFHIKRYTENNEPGTFKHRYDNIVKT